MQRAGGSFLLWKALERYGPRHADVNPSRKVHCEHQRRYTRAPHSQLRVAQAEKGGKKKRGLYVLLGTEKKKIVQKTNGGCALMGGS